MRTKNRKQLGLSNDSGGGGVTFVALKAKTSDTDKTPFFGINEKVDGEWKIKETFKHFNGLMKDIDLSSYPWENQVVDTVKMTFDDVGQKYVVEAGLNTGIMRSLLNSLCNCEKIGEVSMDLYLNKEGYASIAIKNSDERTDWKYKKEDFPVVQKNKKGVVIDDEAYIEFLRGLVKEVKDQLASQNSGSNKSESQAENRGSKMELSVDDSGDGKMVKGNDNLPF